MPTLVEVRDEREDRAHTFFHDVFLGRHESCAIVVEDRRASRKHARVLLQGDEVVLEDLKSRNGTYVNGQPIQRAVLNEGDQVKICGRTFIYRVGAPRKHKGSSLGGTMISGVRTTLMGDVDLHNSRIEVATSDGNVEPELEVSAQTDIGTMLQIARANASASEATGRIEVILTIANALSTLHDPEELLAEIMKQLGGVFRQADHWAVLLRSEGAEDLLEPVAARQRQQSEDGLIQIRLSPSIVHEVVDKRLAVLCRDVGSDDRFRNRKSIKESDIRSMIAVPLAWRDEVLGLIYVDTRSKTKPFRKNDLTLLNIIAPQVAMAIKNASLVAAVKRETERRTSLARYLSPDIVQQIFDGVLSIDLGGDLKRGTIFFSDIIGFTSMSERLSPQQVVAKLNRYFHVMEDAIFQHQGTIDKFQGDAIMAFWGVLAPVAHPELAAIRAAMQMQRELFTFNAELIDEGHDPIYMGMGLNTGEVIAGNLGSNQKIEYTVIGDNVNVASRIESCAGRCQVLVSEETFKEVRHSVVAFGFGPAQVKGKAELITVHSIRGVASLEARGGTHLCWLGYLASADSSEASEVQALWGVEEAGGSVLLELGGTGPSPEVGSAVILQPLIPERKQIAEIPGEVVEDFSERQDHWRVRVRFGDHTSELLRLVRPGTQLVSRVSLHQLKRG